MVVESWILSVVTVNSDVSVDVCEVVGESSVGPSVVMMGAGESLETAVVRLETAVVVRTGGVGTVGILLLHAEPMNSGTQLTTNAIL